MSLEEDEATAKAERFLKQQLGLVDFSICKAQAGDSNHTFMIQGEKKLVLKLENYRDWDIERRRETAVLEMLEDSEEVITPGILNAGEFEGTYFRLLEEIDGFSLHRFDGERDFREISIGEKKRYSRMMGETLARIHEFRSFSGCGEFEVNEGNLETPHGNWSEAILEMQEWWFDILRREGFEDIVKESRKVLGDYSRILDEVDDFRLLHMEFDLRNLLFRNDEVAVLDWEKAAAGDPMLDLIVSEERLVWLRDERHDEEVREAFYDGYSSIRSINLGGELEKLYRFFQVVRFLLIFRNDGETRERIQNRIEDLLETLS